MVGFELDMLWFHWYFIDQINYIINCRQFSWTKAINDVERTNVHGQPWSDDNIFKFTFFIENPNLFFFMISRRFFESAEQLIPYNSCIQENWSFFTNLNTFTTSHSSNKKSEVEEFMSVKKLDGNWMEINVQKIMNLNACWMSENLILWDFIRCQIWRKYLELFSTYLLYFLFLLINQTPIVLFFTVAIVFLYFYSSCSSFAF